MLSTLGIYNSTSTVTLATNYNVIRVINYLTIKSNTVIEYHYNYDKKSKSTKIMKREESPHHNVELPSILPSYDSKDSDLL